MKTHLFSILFLTVIFFGYSQENGITYQAVIYEPSVDQYSGQMNSLPMVNSDICIQFSLIDLAGNIEYEEVVATTTDEFGMVNLVIGTHEQTDGYVSSFEDVLWDGFDKFLQVGLDLSSSCSRFEEISYQRFNYVPLAYNAKNAERVTGIVPIANGGTGGTTQEDAKINLGLNNVENTSDADKPISNATQIALDLKEDKSNKSLDVATDATSDIKYPTVKAVKTYVDANLSSGGAALTAEVTRATLAEEAIADNLDTEIDNRTAADATLQSNIDALETSSTTAISAVQSDVDANELASDTADTTLQTNIDAVQADVNQNESDSDAADAGLQNNINTLQGELDATQIGAGLGTDGGYTANVGANYINASTSIIDATEDLDAQVKTNADAISSVNNLADGSIYLGNASNQATEVTLTGDLTIDNTGVSAIGTSKVQTGMIADANVTNAKLDKANIPLSGFGATTSAGLAGVISDETGTGSIVLGVSPTFTGTPLAPTATAGTNTTQIATTAFVADAVNTATSGNFVDLTTAQTIAGTKMFSDAITANSGLSITNGATSAGTLAIYEDSDDGTNKVTIQSQAMAADYTLTLPADDGDANQVLTTDGSGALSWEATGITNSIADADGNTKIQVEESSNEDKIRFDLAGTESFVIENGTGGLARFATSNTQQNVIIGQGAMENADNANSMDEIYNVVIGYNAARNLNGGSWEAFSNTILGREAGYSMTNSSNNTIIGESAGYYTTTGNNNTFLGQGAGYRNTSGTLNTFLGRQAGNTNTGGSNNIAIGYRSIFNNGATMTIGNNNNTVIGHQAGYKLGNNDDGNVMIGYQAGYNETGANKLYIDNSNTSTPLIYGDFSTDALTINGTLTSKGELTVGAYTLPATDGTASQVLSTDGSGAVSWNTPSTTATAYSGVLPVANGGTGSSTQNFVDLTTDQTIAGAKTFTGTVSGITSTMVGLGNVDNTSDVDKPVSTATQTALDLKANIASPTLTGTPLAPTATAGTNTTQIATTAFVADAVNTATTGNFVDLTTDQTVAGTKTFSSNVLINGLTVGRGAGNISTNSASGLNALSSNTTGSYNTATGLNALKENIIGSGNSATGAGALIVNTASNNTAMGSAALFNNTLGDSNAAFGNGALIGNISGSSNTALGKSSLGTNTTGNNNTAIGVLADVGSAALTNATAIGYGATVNSSNTVQLGNSSVTSVTTSGAITAASYVKSGGTASQFLKADGSVDVTSYAPLASPTFTGTVSGITSTMVGLGNVDNTSDANKPVSTATQTALDLKANIDSPTLTGTPLAPTATAGTNTTQIATTAFVTDAVSTAATGNFVDLTTAQTIAGTKTFSSEINVKGLIIGLGSEGVASNTSIGINALVSNSTGINNVAIGEQAGFSITGSNNVAIGTATNRNAAEGDNNVAIGNGANYQGTSGSNNISLGTLAYRQGNSGSSNIAMGSAALYDESTGSNNIALGDNSSRLSNGGEGNITLGFRAGNAITSGDYNVVIGYDADVSNGALMNATAIGNGAIVTSSNSIQLGNTAITDVITNGNVTANGYKTPTGTSLQYLMADGSVSAGATPVREVADEFSATAAQTSFTLTQTPSVNSKVKTYVNGIRISNAAYSVSGTTLTYDPANNGGYALSVNDRIQMDYYY